MGFTQAPKMIGFKGLKEDTKYWTVKIMNNFMIVIKD